MISPSALYSALTATGHQLAWTDYVTARNPSPDDAATLNIPNGTPAITTRRITRDTTHSAPGRPVAMEDAHRSAAHPSSPTASQCTRTEGPA